MEDPNVDSAMIERQGPIDRKTAPIVETPDTVSYLGVRLEKSSAPAGLYVPRKEQYSDYINDRFLTTA